MSRVPRLSAFVPPGRDLAVGRAQRRDSRHALLPRDWSPGYRHHRLQRRQPLHPHLPGPLAQRASLSGFWVLGCLWGMHIAYIVVTILAALANGIAASMDFAGAASVKLTADRLQVSQRWMGPLGVLLASGALGLLSGLAVPALGMAAAAGLVAYFVCALGAHIRVRDRGVGGAVTFLLLAIAALLVNIGYHHYW